MRLLPFAFLGLLLVACAPDNWADSLGTANQKLCVPNQTLVCKCGLDSGSQLCRVDQTLTECVCPKKSKPTSSDSTSTEEDEDEQELDEAPAPGARCGDGVVDIGEACDDGNEEDGDGCSAKCNPDGSPPSGETCPGQPVTLWKGTPVAFGGSTNAYKHDHASWCDEWAMGPDRVYAVTPKADGVLTVDATLATGFDAVISIRQGSCTNGENEPLCEVTRGKPFKGVITVKKDEPVYVFIDGAGENGKPGAFSIELDLR